MKTRPRGNREYLLTGKNQQSYPCQSPPQARQREFVVVISLGCVAALFVKHVSQEYNGTLAMMVTFIPLVVHMLLVRDIFVKWENR